MFKSKTRLTAIWALFFLAFYPQKVSADIFKSSEFLTWDRDAQEFYIRTSVGMAGLIAGRNDKTHGQCLSDWYFTEEAVANEQILDVMRQYPEYHPRGVIVAVMEKQCGSIIYANR